MSTDSYKVDPGDGPGSERWNSAQAALDAMSRGRASPDDPTPPLAAAFEEGLAALDLAYMKQGHAVSPYLISSERGQDAVRAMLELIGEDPKREGLVETPQRVVRAWAEWFRGYGQDPADLFKTFEDGAEKADEIVLLTDIPVHSHCEHHVTPIIGVAHVAYIPRGKIVGISKLARLVDLYARRLQVQERLTNQIADAIEQYLDPAAVGVIITAKHFCMATRGVMMPQVDTTTSAMRGAFRDEVAARAELLQLVQMSAHR